MFFYCIIAIFIVNNIEDYHNYKGEIVTMVSYHTDMETCTVENEKNRLWWGYISDLKEIESKENEIINSKLLAETL
jgi:hypothetical protein